MRLTRMSICFLLFLGLGVGQAGAEGHLLLTAHTGFAARDWRGGLVGVGLRWLFPGNRFYGQFDVDFHKNPLPEIGGDRVDSHAFSLNGSLGWRLRLGPKMVFDAHAVASLVKMAIPYHGQFFDQPEQLADIGWGIGCGLEYWFKRPVALFLMTDLRVFENGKDEADAWSRICAGVLLVIK